MDYSRIIVDGQALEIGAAKKIWERAKYSKWGQGVSNDEELRRQLNFRLDYLNKELGIQYKKIGRIGRVITYPAKSNEEFILAFTQQIEKLEQNFGLHKSVLQKCPEIVFSSMEMEAIEPTSINQKLIYIRENFGLDTYDLNKYPYPLSYSIVDNGSENCLPYKLKYYTEKLGFSKKEFRKSPPILSLNCTADNSPTSVPNKVNFLREYAGIGEKQLRNLPVLLSLDCDPNSTSPSALINKIKILREEFELGEAAWRSYPVLLMMDCDPTSDSSTSVAHKMRFFKEKLGFDHIQINSYPQLLGMDCSWNSQNPAAIVNKVKFYESIGITTDELKKFVNLLGYDCDPNSTSDSSIVGKIKVFDELGLGKDVIMQMPILLGMPTNKIKIRYMLYKSSPLASIALKPTAFIQNEAKTYARMCYLNEIRYNANKQAVIFPEQRFVDTFGKTSAALMDCYPLDEVAVHRVEADFSNTVGEDIRLNKDELGAVCQGGK